MDPLPTLFCLVSPDEWSAPGRYGFLPVLYAYRIESARRLQRACPPLPLKGGLLGITASGLPRSEDQPALCRLIAQECRLREARGVFFDPEELRQLPFLQQLEGILQQTGLELWVPEPFGAALTQSRVLISSAISGGSFSLRFREAAERYGAGRVVMALEQVREDFLLPCPGGSGQPLSSQELEALRTQCAPAVYWSDQLAAHYFTYRRQSQLHFVLFDDRSSLVHKLRMAAPLQIGHIFAPWQEIAPYASLLCDGIRAAKTPCI